MSRALLVRAFALAALAGILVLRSDSRGEGPAKATRLRPKSACETGRRSRFETVRSAVRQDDGP